ncbi:MAG: MucB/RseB C-terminal domain-containing protein [Succinivibrio sp.]|nr:MucB/RseB C-terminal domain-containing protein [Succinivibrio sp.]
MLFFHRTALALDCAQLLQATQRAVSHNSFAMTVVSGNAKGVNTFLYTHSVEGASPLSVWQDLNGEIQGYAITDGRGLDFNRDKNVYGPLTWHPTLIYDKLMSESTVLNNYSCVLTGRARIAGHRTNIMRLSPIDDLRYSYVIASDENTNLPIELVVNAPGGATVLRLSVSAFSAVKAGSLKFIEDVFDYLAKNAEPQEQNGNMIAPGAQEQSAGEGSKKNADHTLVATKDAAKQIWKELRMPQCFRLVDQGVMQDQHGNKNYFQMFTDGLNDFRVYKTHKTTLMFPQIRNNTLSVYRKEYGAFEYAVVGEVPLVLAEYVLGALDGRR